MPVKGYFRVDGLEAYLEKLVQAGRDVDAAAEKAVEAGGQVVFDAMIKDVAVDTGGLKAHLQKTGKSEMQRSGNFHWIEIGLLDLGRTLAGYGERGKRSGRKQYLREWIRGIFLEYGTVHMAPRPYVRPAFDQNRSKVKQAEIDSLKKSGYL